MDNFIVFPYTANRLLGQEAATNFVVKARSSEAVAEAISRIGGYLKGLVDPMTGSYNVYSDQQWQEQQNEQMASFPWCWAASPPSACWWAASAS